MCQVYAGADALLYANSSRSIRVNGFVTSIRLENEFWKILEEMSRAEGVSTSQFIGVLYQELVNQNGEVQNFTSFLRVACTIYLSRRLEQWTGVAEVAADGVADEVKPTLRWTGRSPPATDRIVSANTGGD